MKNILFVFLVFITSSITAANFESGHLYAGASQNYTFTISAGVTGVFTLKNTSNTSDLDIFIFSNGHQIASGLESGAKTELVTVDGGDYGVSVTVKVKNAGNYSTGYQLYGHGISLSNALNQALLDAGVNWLLQSLLGGGSNDSNSRNVERVSTFVLGLAKGEDSKAVTLDMLLNELTSELREEFGYGFIGDLAVNTGVYYYRDMYANYFK